MESLSRLFGLFLPPPQGAKPMNVIQVRIDKHYGQIVLYPQCAKSHLFCAIAKTKTITLEMEKHIRQLGFDIIEKTLSRS